MAYLQNPHQPLLWESDDSPPWGKYRAKDGTFHDSGREAIEHNRKVDESTRTEWDGITDEEIREALK